MVGERPSHWAAQAGLGFTARLGASPPRGRRGGQGEMLDYSAGRVLVPLVSPAVAQKPLINFSSERYGGQSSAGPVRVV